MDDKARKMAKKAQDSARTRESAAHRSENAAKQAMDTALRNLYKKHPELSGMVTFGDAYLPGNASQPQAKAKPQSTPDGQAKGVSMPDGQAKPDPTPVSVSVSVTVDPHAAHQHDFDTRDTGDDDYWSLPAPKASAYRPPSLQGHSLDTVLVETDTAAEPAE